MSLIVECLVIVLICIAAVWLKRKIVGRIMRRKHVARRILTWTPRKTGASLL